MIMVATVWGDALHTGRERDEELRITGDIRDAHHAARHQGQRGGCCS